MELFQFLDSSAGATHALRGGYHLGLVSLSFAVATVAAYAALGLASRIGAAKTGAGRTAWLATGSVAMGTGVWAMHFIAMLALRMGPAVRYDVTLTAVSIVPAVIASAVALHVTSRPSVRWRPVLLGGVLMGLGIGAMHYTGMAAMRMNAELRYDPTLFGASLLVAATLSVIALYSHCHAIQAKKAPLHWTKVGAGLVMGSAVVAMHYTGMAATYMVPVDGNPVDIVALDPRWLALGVGAASFLILGLAVTVAVVDARLRAASSVARATRGLMLNAIEHMSDGFSVWDAQGRLVICNSQYQSFHPGVNLMPGVLFEDVTRHTVAYERVSAAEEEENEWVRQQTERLRSEGKEILQSKDGRWLQISRTQVAGGQSIVLYTDITDLKRAAEDLEQARAAAEAANRAKSQFLSTMSHELRTPLNGVLGHAQILQRGHDLSHTHRESLRAIESCGQHLLDLINDVLDLSRIESGQLEVDVGPCDLSRLLAGVGDIVRPRADAKGLTLSLRAEPDLPCGIRIDAAKLRQVLVNLLGNAVKFTERGEITLEVGVPEPGQIDLTVRDTGAGIPALQFDAIFDAFRQTEAGKATEGTGLGLAISRRLVEAMRGTLTVESEVGSGSAFTISLPLVEVDEALVAETEAQSLFGERAARLAPGQFLAVLVADDRQTNREILVRLLQGAGFDTDEAENGQQALAKLRARRFPLVLMDVRMPVMNGLEATRIIRQNAALRDTVVIAISASVFPDARQHLIEAGFSDFLGKPLRASELFSKIAEHLDVSFIESESPGPNERTDAGILAKGVADALARRLRQAVKVGDVSELSDVASQLHGEGGATWYAEEIERLTRAFDFDGLLRIAQDLDHARAS